MVLPRQPEATEGCSEEDLAAHVSQNTMIGVALPNTPSDMP